ncbi:superoxide dismutase [Cu-Zn]-like [Mytilus californianus]|uniref:superoxide dismutase [Cu-Zn]-like n=1 Tax=Mytilus californianus TaxID=6549 RepID=UPI002245FEC4|nr:superoxide dismutase [Cu-Zn]-like [Mytilus californianus]
MYSSKFVDCSSVGPQFNPLNKTHGAPHDHERHVGSLGNVKANMWGIADVYINDSMISLQETSDLSILNRSLVIHTDADDLGKGGNAESLITGNAGERIGCCQIIET